MVVATSSRSRRKPRPVYRQGRGFLFRLVVTKPRGVVRIKVLWHSNAPWSPSGYGQQTALWVPRIAAMGHEVAISAFYGHEGAPGEWQGHQIFSRGQHPYGGDIVGMHARAFDADLVITLMDLWALPVDTLKDFKTAAWMPIDTD